MWRKHLIGIFLSLLIFSGFALFYLIFHPLKSDKQLIDDFHRNQTNFEKIVRMANEDKNVKSIYEDFVLLNGYENWRDDSQNGFSTKRWNAYKELLSNLENPSLSRISKEGDILEIVSASTAVSEISEDETIVITKGYAYSLKEPAPLVESLDELGFKDGGTFYKKIDENWYLYFDSGISKPE
jgi:hypothetical protein